MEEERNCPSCGVANPVTRVTCQVCHSKLIGKINPFQAGVPTDTPTASEVVLEKKVVREKKKRGRKPKTEQKTRKPRTPKEPAQESAEPKPESPVKRKRHRKPKSVPMQYFALAGQALVPVVINLQVRPIRTKEIKAEAKALVTLWNRNKNLLK